MCRTYICYVLLILERERESERNWATGIYTIYTPNSEHYFISSILDNVKHEPISILPPFSVGCVLQHRREHPLPQQHDT